MSRQAQAAFAVSMMRLERDTTVRSTFIRVDDDNADGEDTTMPAFSQHTRSGPSNHGSKRRNWSDILEEESGSDVESGTFLGGNSEEPKTLGSSWATHSRGACVPCAYSILKSDGCWKGSQCERCHFCTDVELRQWKKTSRKAKTERRKLEREAREGAMQATEERQAAPDKAEAGRSVEKVDSSDDSSEKIDSSDDSSEGMSRCDSLKRAFVVKNTFLHFSADEDEDLLPLRRCESDPCLRQGGGGGNRLGSFRARLSELAASARSEKRGASGYHSSCSTSQSPSARGHSGWQATWSSGSTDAGEAVDETRGASFETHQSGQCQPCFYFNFKADGCRKGADCIYCHFCSGEECRQRKRTGKTVAKHNKRADGMRCHSKTRDR